MNIFQNLKMSPDEISNFLIVNPIEITNNYITSGRHRGIKSPLRDFKQ